MDNRAGKHLAGKKDRAPRSKAKSGWPSWMRFSPKKRSPPQVLRQPTLAELPSNPLRHDYHGTHRNNHMGMSAAPPVITTRYPQHPPLPPLQELGQQAPTTQPEGTSSTEIIIAIMGVTGAGKSYFINKVTGNSKVEVGCGLHSCTSKVQPYSFEHGGVKITLVDTPGFDDTKRSDTEVLQEIAEWTTATYRKDQLLSGIIYLHPITHTRMEGSSMKNLRMFQSLCGQQVLENVLLTTTQWSNVNQAEAEFRENSLRNDFWGGLIGKGAALQRFHGTRESGLELIHKLMSNMPKPLDIQDQIVKQNMTLLETNAGKCVNEELIAQEKKFREKLESLEKRLHETVKAMQDEMKTLVEEQTRTKDKLQNALDEMKFFTELHAAEVRRREAKEEKARAVIAVAIKDIGMPAHIANVFTRYTTRGRLISDIKNYGEFEADTIEVTINYQLNFPPGIRDHTKTFKELFDAGIRDTNYIVLDGAHYRCKSGTPIRVGNKKFVIFGRG